MKCLKIYEEILPDNHTDIADLYLNLAILYTNTQKYDRSEEFYIKCLKIREEVLPPNHPDIVSIHNHLRALHRRKADSDKAKILA